MSKDNDLIMKLICGECQMEMKHISFKIAERMTIKEEFSCPRCKKSIELWLI